MADVTIDNSMWWTFSSAVYAKISFFIKAKKSECVNSIASSGFEVATISYKLQSYSAQFSLSYFTYIKCLPLCIGMDAIG